MIMRHVVLDTETTGLSPDRGHRIVEIGCVEIQDSIVTGRTYHRYFNPERDMPDEAFRVHGLSQDFLAGHPTFEQHCEEFLDFISNATLVIHNASFDMKFLNAELSLLKKPSLSNSVIDTLAVARKKFPGSPASLDALCRRFQVDTHHRKQHGALLDAQLLTHVYQLMSVKSLLHFSTPEQKVSIDNRPFRTPRVFPICPHEKKQYQQMCDRVFSAKKPFSS